MSDIRSKPENNTCWIIWQCQFLGTAIYSPQCNSIISQLVHLSLITAAVGANVTTVKAPVFCFIFRAAGLFFFSAFLINLLAGIVFLLGSNIAIVCDGVSDYKLLQKVSSDILI